jgi:hypothetical protein
MQGAKVLKIRLGSPLAEQLERAVATEGVTAGEIVRRALVLYFRENPVERAESSLVESVEGPWKGPGRAHGGPAAPLPPSSPPPSSPPAPPQTPPSLSPPAPSAARPAGSAAGAEPADPAGASGILFAEMAPPPAPPSPPPLLLFPCVADRRSRKAREWPLTADLMAQWEETFPGIDVLGEARKAREWLLANHLKTFGGMRIYLFRWLCKAQDSGRFMRRTAGPPRSSAPAPGSLEDVYGFASWDEWEEALRQAFAGSELEQELARLAEIRAQWEAKDG